MLTIPSRACRGVAVTRVTMQLKTADDRAPAIESLEALRRRPDIDARTARPIEDEIWSIRLGAKADSDAAYQTDKGR